MDVVLSEDFNDWKNYYGFNELVGEIQELTRSGQKQEARRNLRMFLNLVEDFQKSVERELDAD